MIIVQSRSGFEYSIGQDRGGGGVFDHMKAPFRPVAKLVQLMILHT